MMEWTDRYRRFFHRLLSRRALLYTEMVTTAAVLRGDRARIIRFDPFEHPVAIPPTALCAGRCQLRIERAVSPRVTVRRGRSRAAIFSR
jgi:hypothetical protein